MKSKGRFFPGDGKVFGQILACLLCLFAYICQVVIPPLDRLQGSSLFAILVCQNPVPSCIRSRCNFATRVVVAQRDIQLEPVSAMSGKQMALTT